MHHSGTELINPFKVLEHVGIRQGWHVADLGCGALGHFVFPAAQLVGGTGKVYAVDIQKAALQAIEKTAKQEQFWNVHPVWSDIDVTGAARIPPASLDLVIVANNFFLSQNRGGLVNESVRLTKPGGFVLIIEWKKERSPIGPAFENRLAPEEIKKEMMHSDLHFKELFDAGDSHFALLFQLPPRGDEPEVLSFSHASA